MTNGNGWFTGTGGSAFRVTSDTGEVFMEREPDGDGEFIAPELRALAAKRLFSEDRKGLEIG